MKLTKEYLELLDVDYPDYKIPKNTNDIVYPKIVTEENLSNLEKIRKTNLP